MKFFFFILTIRINETQTGSVYRVEDSYILFEFQLYHFQVIIKTKRAEEKQRFCLVLSHLSIE